ncbi:KICSTOR complex protein kaptin-like isoform X2 [Photinus pyralis]|uniref:KICSTOR complex protein kaptin-like isoform X2 n=1 Tax=Photinus pyralis TaxID=7054 RepID=UPI0012676A67|nr:KICSTOR complex protein kaptin-like isoform X2 [Photinus pyralis]
MFLVEGAEIISMDAFNKSETANDFVIGITIIKNSTDLHALETFLNIYSGWEETKDFNMEVISQNCLNNIELKYIPYQLTHTFLTVWLGDNLLNKEIVFLLSGSDCKIHMYQENKLNHTYKEMEIGEYFPEFLKPPTVVMWMDIYYYSEYSKRLTAFGCECGYMRLCCVNVKISTILYNFSTDFNNTISSVYIYPNERNFKQPTFIKDVYAMEPKENTDPVINLIVTNTLLPPVCFRDILRHGLRRYDALPRLDLTSVLTSTEIANVNFDGSNQIFIGTSNHELIAYEWDGEEWFVSNIRTFASPIFGVKYHDITGDGVKELIVLTMKGIIILQHDISNVNEVLLNKLKTISIPDIKRLTLN